MARKPTIESRMTAEALRLEEARKNGVPWRQWGPYLSERGRHRQVCGRP